MLHICAIQPLLSQDSWQFRMMLTLTKPLYYCDTCLTAGSRCQTEGHACSVGSLVVSEDSDLMPSGMRTRFKHYLQLTIGKAIIRGKV
jgi:hypothetical protein